ncbi:MAG: methionyl-tRNA formyltransferase [bacterium]|nr:methionyl-tRNA formyltransferase [bacterium]
MTCILLGTPTFAIPTAEVLMRTSTCTLLGVITKPDEPAGRTHAMTPPPLASWAKEHGVQYWQPGSKDELTSLLTKLRPDIGVVVAYGKIIPQDALTIPRFGFVNLHPSLLPRWRGPSPIPAAIAAGDVETGVTLMRIDAEVDHGPILAQERVPLSSAATRSSLENELAKLGARLLERTLPDYLAGGIAPKPQDHTQATMTPLLTRDDGRIDWRASAATIERKVRAYEGWPGTWCTLPDGERLKILEATVGAATDVAVGAIVRSDGTFGVASGSHQLLVLQRVQPEGKPVMDGSAFLRGHQDLWILTQHDV